MFGVTGLRFRLLADGGGGPSLPRFFLWSLVWVFGHALGGVVLGAALGWFGSGLEPALQPGAIVLMACTCFGLGMHQFGWLRWPLPQWRRQVRRQWMQELPWNVVALGYGVQLGCGVGTYIPVATTYAALSFALLSGSPPAGAMTMGLFGVARSLAPVAVAPYIASPLRSLRFAAAVDRYEPWVFRVNGCLLLLAAAALTLIRLRPGGSPWQ